MMHEVRSIPPAPRRVRLRPLLAHRWPLLAVGGTFVVLGTLVAWLMFLYRSADQQLDSGPTLRLDGVVQKLEPPVPWDDSERQRATFTFRWAGNDRGGHSFVVAHRHRVGERVEVEVLASDDNVSRVAGSLVQQDRAWLSAPFWLVCTTAPGALVLLVWFVSFLLLRHVIVHGDATAGRVVEIGLVKNVLPEMLRVRYEFRDHHAALRTGTHWVRLHGVLCARLLRQVRAEAYEAMPVLHDRRVPSWNRLLLPADFLARPLHFGLPANENA